MEIPIWYMDHICPFNSHLVLKVGCQVCALELGQRQHEDCKQHLQARLSLSRAITDGSYQEGALHNAFMAGV